MVGEGTYVFTDEMGYVNPLGDPEGHDVGKSYERACRAMIVTGAEWLDDHPDADVDFSEYEDVFGVIESESGDATELVDAMVGSLDKTPTGAMVHASVQHVLAIGEVGWEEYVEIMENSE